MKEEGNRLSAPHGHGMKQFSSLHSPVDEPMGRKKSPSKFTREWQMKKKKDSKSLSNLREEEKEVPKK